MIKEHYRPGLEVEDPRHWTPLKRIENVHEDLESACSDYFTRRPARIKKTDTLTEVEVMLVVQDDEVRRPLTAKEKKVLRDYKATIKEKVKSGN